MTARASGAFVAWPPERWHRLRRLAARLSRRPEEAEDLLQDVLMAALEAGRSEERWLHGVMRRRAAFLARGAVRRMRRETAAVRWPSSDSGGEADAVREAGRGIAPDALLARLPPASRRVLTLALNGLGPVEIQWLLGINPAAFRQRLTPIRKAVAGLPADLGVGLDACWSMRERLHGRDPRFGLRRRLLAAVSAELPAVGGHDPDGHPLLVRGHAHVPARRGNHGSAAAGDSRPET